MKNVRRKSESYEAERALTPISLEDRGSATHWTVAFPPLLHLHQTPYPALVNFGSKSNKKR